VILGVSGGVVVLALLFWVFADWARKARHAANMNSLKQIGLAMQNYDGVYKQLPTPRALNGGDPVELSWRVSILGYFGEMSLYNRFDQTSGWDSPANRNLLDRIPAIYTPMQQRKEGETATFFQLFTGPGTAFPNNDKVTLGGGLLANNFLCAEALQGVPWTKPADMAVEPGQPLPLPKTEFLVCMGDGSVRLIERRRVNDDALRWYLKPNPGDAPPLD
jgi:hypothetical protein